MTVTISGGTDHADRGERDGGETNCYHSACTTLIAEALAAQSANIATVSRRHLHLRGVQVGAGGRAQLGEGVAAGMAEAHRVEMMMGTAITIDIASTAG